MSKLIVGVNDLATLCPNVAKEWNYKKNGDLLPIMFTIGSNKKVWWQCNKGHEWKAMICNRALKHMGCPKCYADSQTSFAEQAIFYFLDMIFPGEVKNRYKLKDKENFFEADIYLPKMNIVIEHNGLHWHKNKQEKDIIKECCFKAMGMRFISVVEHNCNKIIDNCILYDCYKNRDENLTWAIQELFLMLNISSLFVNVATFRNKILEFCHTNEIKNSLAITHPEIAREWNYEKNSNLKPEYFRAGSGEKVWWKCNKGHEWKTDINSRVRHKTGCPICANMQLLTGYNDLETVHPELAKEWNYDKNDGLLPSQVLFGSSKRVWWKCKDGHEWQVTIDNRVCNRSGCPICTNRQVLVGYNDLQTVKPDLAKEWDYNKNGNLLPSQVLYGSHKKVWWICKHGHSWQSEVRDRYHGHGCPVCSNQRILVGYNDFQTLYPELAKEWNYKKNRNLLPTMFTISSEQKIWWTCKKCGYEWLTKIINRTRRKCGCPECGKLKGGRHKNIFK